MSKLTTSAKNRLLELAQREATKELTGVRKQEALKAYKRATLMHKGSGQSAMWGTDEGSAITSAIQVFEMLQTEANGLVYRIAEEGELGDVVLDRFAETLFEVITGRRDTHFTNFTRALALLKSLQDAHTFTKSEIEQMEQEEQDRLEALKLEDALVFDDTMDEDYEIYFDEETGDQYKVPVELVRDFSRAEVIGNKFVR